MPNCKIINNIEVAPMHYKVTTTWTGGSINPGQFVMVKVTGSSDPLLRRPFSVYNVSKNNKSIELVYKVIGRGTDLMSAWKKGMEVDILGPLGNSFPKPKKGEKTVLVAGGIGIASFYNFAKVNKNAVLLFGARTKKEAALAKEFKKLGLKVKVATEDGSAGTKGYVTALMAKEILKNNGKTVIYSCGPIGMLNAVAEVAKQNGDPKCYVSLETSMACGIGACLGCAVRQSENAGASEYGNYKMVCADGPVFDSKDLNWSSL